MKQDKFICIIGTDGSGKTTQCSLLIDELENRRDERVQYAWCKFESVPLRYVVKLSKAIFSFRGEDMQHYDERKEKKNSILSRSYLRIPFLLYILVHYYTQIIRDVWIPLLRGHTVVCDRYVYDTMVDIAVDFGYSETFIKRLLSAYCLLIPTPDIVFYIDVPPSVSVERKEDIPTIGFVEAKKEAYDRMIDQCNPHVINGTLRIEEIHEKIKRRLFLT